MFAVKLLNRRALGLAAGIVAALGAPALAAEAMPQAQTSSSRIMIDAFETEVPALTYTVAQDRRAAITYMDDALKLIDLGAASIKAGALHEARSALMGASGKLSTAYLLNFRDRPFSQSTWPLTLAPDRAAALMDADSQRALLLLASLKSQVASIAESQLATMGGGGGGMPGFEPIELNEEIIQYEIVPVPDEDDAD